MNKLLLLFLVLLISTALPAQESGYMNLITFGALTGASSDDNPVATSLISEHLFRFSGHFSAGAMIGLERLNENTMPLAASLKLLLPASKCDFFVGGLTGYSIALDKPEGEEIRKARGGFLAGAETGFLIHVNSGASVVIALGYRYNKLNYELENWWAGNYKRTATLNRFSIRVGIAIY